MKKRVVQALGCILAMTMVVGSLTACGGKSEKKAEKKAGSDVKVAIICSAADPVTFTFAKSPDISSSDVFTKISPSTFGASR